MSSGCYNPWKTTINASSCKSITFDNPIHSGVVTERSLISSIVCKCEGFRIVCIFLYLLGKNRCKFRVDRFGRMDSVAPNIIHRSNTNWTCSNVHYWNYEIWKLLNWHFEWAGEWSFLLDLAQSGLLHQQPAYVHTTCSKKHFISFQLIWMTASTSNSHCRRKIELRMRAEWGSSSGKKHLANTLHGITESDLPFDWLVGLTYWLVEWAWCCLKSTLCISYHTSLRMNRRENQNSLKRNRHLCKSDSRFISTGNGVNVADKKLIEIKSSPINHCVWSSFFYIGARAPIHSLISAFHLQFICWHYFSCVVECRTLLRNGEWQRAKERENIEALDRWNVHTLFNLTIAGGNSHAKRASENVKCK